MSRYSHVFSIAYTVESDDELGEEVTDQQHYAAILRRAKQALDSGEMQEAVGPPEDTYDIAEARS